MRKLSILVAMAAAIGCSSGSGNGSTTGGSSGGAGSTGGSGGNFVVVNDCQRSAYVDVSGNSPPTVNYGVNQQLVYQPQCAIVHAGQTLTFSGDGFNIHPLTPGAAPSLSGANAGTSPNPITTQTTGTSTTVTFANPGFYPYYCAAHQSLGMYGAVWVQ